MTYLLYNPLSNNNTGTHCKDIALDELRPIYNDIEEINIVSCNINEFSQKLKKTDTLILVGGDGTLSIFANYIYSMFLQNQIYMYRAGTGNDFFKDVAKEDEKLILLNPFLKKLPKVTINGKETRFINGIGYGIDGEVCVVADKMKNKGKKRINYTSIALKLLFSYNCPDATVIIDGVEKNYKKVWLASTMNGRYYGGGMMMAPNQNRLENNLSFCVVHGSNPFRILTLFPTLFKGKHIKYTKLVDIIKAKRIEVKFSSPNALQIDGEVVNNVTSYIAEIDY